MFPLFAPRIFKIAGRASAMEPLFNEIIETSAFYSSVQKPNTCMVCSDKQPFWKFRENPFEHELQAYNTQFAMLLKANSLPNFLKSWKCFETYTNFQEIISNGGS